MNFDYDRISNDHDKQGHMWISYSDLFMILSFIFLLLYVVASLNAGAVAVQTRAQLSVAQEKNDNLAAQVAVFERLSNNYLQESATESEKQLYDRVVSKLSSLQEKRTAERKELKDKLAKVEAEKQNLDFYQGTIKSLMVAHLTANKRINDRQQKINVQSKEINKLSQTVEDQEKTLSRKEQLIEQAQNKLEQTKQQASQERSKREAQASDFKKRFDSIVADRDSKVSALSAEASEKRKALDQSVAQLTALRTDLNQTQQKNQQLMVELTSAQGKNQAQIEAIKQEHAKDNAAREQQFSAELTKQKLTAGEKLAAEQAHRGKLKEANAQYQAKLQGLMQGFAENNSRLKELQDAENKLKGQNNLLNSQLAQQQDRNQTLGRELAASREVAMRRENISKKLAAALKNSGVDIEINPKSGDMILNFGDEYFDAGRFGLKEGMKNILHKAMPLYAKALVGDPNVAKHISNVEIIGFASPTYKTRVVDPNTLDAGDRAAVNYNLDLSYKRARSIFGFIFDPAHMNYPYQKELLPMVKVTGRSFFTEKIEGKDADKLDMQGFCKSYNCNRAQRVIVRFTLKEI